MYRRSKLLCSFSRNILSRVRAGESNARIKLAATGPRCFSLTPSTPDPHQSRPRTFAQAQPGKRLASPPGTQISARPNHEGRVLEVEWAEGGASPYPYVWLRDNCQCPQCFHPTSLARQTLMKDLDLSVEPRDVQVSEDDHVYITWDDDHVSPYEGAWLRERDFRPRARDQRSMFLEPTIRLWGSEYQEELKPHEFTEVMTDDDALYSALHRLCRDGLLLLQNVPQTEDQVIRLCERIGYVKTTHYGPSFEVKVKASPSNIAYASNTLSLHQDLPFNRHIAFLQMLHCIKQVEMEGGDNVFSDGFQVAHHLKQVCPEVHAVLQTQPVDFIDVGTDFVEFDFRARHPTISMTPDGRRYKSIYYNQTVRDSAFDGSPDDVIKLYESLQQFDALLNDPANTVHYKMKNGDMVVFANQRVLHGRRGFQATAETSRHLQGAYVEWDATVSKLRVLAKQRGTESEVFAGNNY